MNQPTLAEHVGVHVNTIGTWERGLTTPRTADLPALAKALRTTVVWLVVGDVGEAAAHDLAYRETGG